MGLHKNIFVWLSGGDPEALEKSVISEQRKYIKLGLIILVPAILSWLGMWFASPYIGFNGNERIVISIVWSAIILSIDTYLVTSLDKRFAQKNKKRYNSLAVFRILISIFLGVIISHPLVLRILEPNINEEIGNMKKAERFKIMSINRDSSFSWNRNNQKELDSVTSRIICKELLLRAEGNGIKMKTECGESSGFNNRSFRYDRFLREIDSLEKYRLIVNAKIADINLMFRNKTDQDLQDLERTFSYDYLKRITALKRLKEKDKTNGEWISHTSLLVWFLLIFLILIDSIAVISKIITPIGEHERILTNLEDFLRHNEEQSNIQKSNIYNRARQNEEAYKTQVIQAIYQRGAHHSPKDIKIAVESILNNTIDDPTPPSSSTKQLRFRLLKQYIFLGGATIMGVVLWYVLKVTIFKDSPNDLSIAMSLYFVIITIIAGILK